MSRKFAPRLESMSEASLLENSGFHSMNEAATNLLRSLQAINDDESDYDPSPESRMNSPLVRSVRELASPGASFHASPMHAGSRNRMRLGPQNSASMQVPRGMQHSSSLPALSRSHDPAVCRARGDRLRSIGQNLLQQDWNSALTAQRSPQVSIEPSGSPAGGGTLSSNFSTFRSTMRSTMRDSGDSWDEMRLQNRNRGQQHPQFDEQASARDDWPSHREEKRSRDQQLPPIEKTTKAEDDWPQHRDPKQKRSKDRDAQDMQHWSPASRDPHRQPRATGAAASGSGPASSSAAGSSEDRNARDELEALRLVHKKTVDELGQASRLLRTGKNEHAAQTQEELKNLRSKLDEARGERDQFKTDLKLARQQNPIAKGVVSTVSQDQLQHEFKKLDQLRGEFMKAQEQFAPKAALLHKVQKELKASQEQLAPKDTLLQKLQTELKATQEQLAENSKEQLAVSDYSSFMSQIINSSARPVLDEALDMRGAELLGMGQYGYVMTCKSKGSNEKVVLKLQGTRWLDVAVKEWNHCQKVGKHPNIVEMKEPLMHRDSDRAIQGRILAGFDQAKEVLTIAGYSDASGVLAGKIPTWFPDAYLCMVTEFMDCGPVSSFMDKQLLTLEGACAVTRQVASALSFMHEQKRSHNNIRPETILLKRSPHGNVLQVKLADLGSAEHAVEHIRDRDFLAYTIWCMVVGKTFSSCPPKETRPEALAEFQKASLLGRRATARGTSLIEAVVGLWNERFKKLDMSQIATMPELEGCEVREPEALEMRRHLTVCANSEVTEHARASLERFQHVVKQMPAANAEARHIDPTWQRVLGNAY